MGLFDSIFGSAPSVESRSVMGPRDPYVDDFFMKIYGKGGTFDPQQQATLFNDRMNSLYDYASNAQPTIANVGGQQFKIMSPIRNQVSMLAGLNDAQMKRSYDPFLGMTQLLEGNRKGAMQNVALPGQQGLLSSIMPALGMWAGMGFPGMGGSSGGFAATPFGGASDATYGSWY
jgi:hypothetical protein